MSETLRPVWIDVRPATSPESCGTFAMHLISSGNRHIVVAGDVRMQSKAGTVASALRAYVVSLASAPAPLAGIIDAADRFFKRALRTEEIPMATLFIALIDEKSATIEYASAGHETALIFNAAGKHEHLLPTGPLLGTAIDSRLRFESANAPFRASDRLVIVNYGITHAKHDIDGKVTIFGSSGVVQAIERTRGSCANPAAEIHRSAELHQNNGRREDATVFVLGSHVEDGSIGRGEYGELSARTASHASTKTIRLTGIR